MAAVSNAPVASRSASSSDLEDQDYGADGLGQGQPERAALPLPASQPPPQQHAPADPKRDGVDGKPKANDGGDDSEGKDKHVSEDEDEDTDTTYLRAIEAHEQRKKSHISPDAGSSGSVSMPSSAEGTASSAGSAPLASASALSAVRVPKLDFSSSHLFAPGRATLEDAKRHDAGATAGGVNGEEARGEGEREEPRDEGGAAEHERLGQATLGLLRQLWSPSDKAPAAVAPLGMETAPLRKETVAFHTQGHASAQKGEEATAPTPHPAPPR